MNWFILVLSTTTSEGHQTSGRSPPTSRWTKSTIETNDDTSNLQDENPTRARRWAAADLGRLQVCRHTVSLQTLSPDLAAAVLVAASLELKAEKQGAHSSYVNSVAFSPDGKSIVSGSYDKTIKVCRL